MTEVLNLVAPTLAGRDAGSVHKTTMAYRGELAKRSSIDELERTYLTMKSGSGAFSDEIKRRFGTVWTDQRVVDLTVDEALKYYSGDINTSTFIDPACGDGNFLVTFYDRLIKASTITDPVERSLSVLRRIYGVDIIERMAAAARIRLVLEHVKRLQSHNLLSKSNVRPALEVVGRNIIHGNTLRSEADTWALEPMEGGLTPVWFREMKFDVVCANPPYTSYGIGSRTTTIKPAAFNDTKTMAESFTQWANNHLTDAGVAGLNLGEMILNGPNRIRQVIAKQINSVVYDALTKGYSAAAGGFLPTVVFTFTKRRHTGSIVVNGLMSRLDITTNRFLRLVDYKQPNYVTSPIFRYSRIGQKLLSGSGSKTATENWKTMIVARNGRANQFFIGLPRHLYISRTNGVANNQCKWFECDQDHLEELGMQYRVGSSGGGGDVKWFAPIDREVGLFLWCFLNSTKHLDIELRQWGKAKRDEASGSGGAAFQLNASDMELCHVPDTEHYKTTRPKQFQAILDFAEAHITSGDVKSYCAGVNRIIDDLLTPAQC